MVESLEGMVFLNVSRVFVHMSRAASYPVATPKYLKTFAKPQYFGGYIEHSGRD